MEALRDVRRLAWGRFALQIPEPVYYRLREKFPSLKSDDPKEREMAWRKIAQDPEYRALVVDRW